MMVEVLGMTYEELAAEEVLALPERELLDYFTNIVAPFQLVAAINIADITTDDVEGSVVVLQNNDVYAEQNTFAVIDND